MFEIFSNFETPRLGRFFSLSNHVCLYIGLGGVLVLCSWLQPVHFLPWVSWHSEILAFAAAAVIFLVFLINQINADGLAIPGFTVPTLFLLLIVLVQAVSGITDYIGDTLVVVMYLLAMVFAVTAGRQYRELSLGMYQLAWGILLAGVVSVVLAILQTTHVDTQYPFVNPMPRWRRPGANLAQPNHLGTLLLWALVSAMFLLNSRKMSRLLTLLLSTILLLGLAMTESRTALLGVLAIAAWAGLQYFQGTTTRRCLMSLSFAGVGTIFFVLWPLFIVGFQEGGWSGELSETGEINTKAGARLTVWPQLLAAVMARPWFGWGVRGVSVAHNAVLDRYTYSEPFTYAHNVILELAIGFGMPVTMLLGGFALVWCFRRITHIRNNVDWYVVALLIPFTLHSMLEFPYAYSYFLFPACFACGILEAKRHHAVILLVPRRLVLAIFAAWVMLAMVLVRDYFLAEEDFRVARFEALRIGHTPVSYERPRLLLLNQLDALNVATRVVPAPDMAVDSLESLRKAALRFPWVAIQNRYALALALNSNVAEAQRQLKVMRAMHGEKMYESIRGQWESLAAEKYPQLIGLAPS